MTRTAHSDVLEIPPEIFLHILSYLDLPDLAAISQVSSYFATLAADPVLHRTRLRVVAPSRVSHSLFGQGPEGFPLRPTVSDLVHRNVMRGLGVERRWRMGLYLHSAHSVKQYEHGLCIQRRHASRVISLNLYRQRASISRALDGLYQSHVLPDVECSSFTIARSLLPVVRQLKWSIQKDNLAKTVRDGSHKISKREITSRLSNISPWRFEAWLELQGRGIIKETERARLTLCPDMKKMVEFFEALGR